MPLFSVVLTTYRRPDRLRSALDSVSRQTERDFEVVVMNNDLETSDKVDEVASGFEFLTRVFHNEENLGQSASRNRGVELAESEVVALLDDDDSWLPTFLEAHRARREADPDVSLVYCGHNVVWSDIPLAPRAQPASPPPDGDLFRSILRGDFTLAANSILTINRDDYLSLGGYDPELSGFPDWDFQLRLSRTRQFAHITEPLANFGFSLSGRDSDPVRRRPELARVREKWSEYPEIDRFVRKTRAHDLFRASFASAFLHDRAAGLRYLAQYSASIGPGWNPRLLARLLILNGLGPSVYARLQNRANAVPDREAGLPQTA